MSPARARRRIALAWGAAAFLAVAALSRGPGISREEASVLAEAGAVPTTPGAPQLRPPLPALLSRATEGAAVAVGLPHLTGYRLVSALFTGLLAALLALLAGDLAGPAAAAFAPALLLCLPRLLLPLVQAGPRAPAAALLLATLMAYRRAVIGSRGPIRLAAALAAGALFGLALAMQLQAIQLLAAVAAHAVLVLLPRFQPAPEPAAPAPEAARPHRRSALLAILAMSTVGPAVALALWPWPWADPLHRLAAAAAAIPGDAPLIHLGMVLAGARPPWGYPLVVTVLALPAAAVAAFAGGLLHALARLLGATTGPERSDELLLLLAAASPFVAAQAGLAARVPGPGPWLAAFPVLAALAARAVLRAARTAWPSRARLLGAALAVAVLLPGVAATVHAYPDLGASWGELAGGAPGAASRGLPRHDGELSARLLDELSARARPGARIRWTAVPPAALAVYTADGRVRPDLTTAASLEEADLAVVALLGGARQEEFQVWAALGSATPVAGTFLDEVPLAWVYARPGAWR